MTASLSADIPAGDDSSIIAGVHRSADDDKQLRDQDFQAPMLCALGLGTAGLVELTEIERYERLARMREGTLGPVHSWGLVIAVDGPDIRLTAFLSGYGLRCLYCHNPDTFLMKDGTPVSNDEILGCTHRYRRIFRVTDGGIIISGDEAMIQPEFVCRILHGAKRMDAHTCLDASNSLGVSYDDDILDHLNLCLLDVKSGLPNTYKWATSGELQSTIDFGDRLAARGTTRAWIRFALVPGLADDWDNIHAIDEIVSKRKDIIGHIEVLPPHQMDRDKWYSPGLKHGLEETRLPTLEVTAKIREYFESLGFEAH